MVLDEIHVIYICHLFVNIRVI